MKATENKHLKKRKAPHGDPHQLKKPLIIKGFNFTVAVRTGLEPATPGVTGRYSNQLNYRTKLIRSAKVGKIIFHSK